MALTGASQRVFGTVDDFNVGEGFPTSVEFHNGTWYMIGQGNDRLHSVNPSNGNATAIGSAGFGVSEFGPRGLASNGETMYMTGSSTRILWVLNVGIGSVNRVGSTPAGFGVGETPRDLGFYNGTLYMTGETNGALYTLNTETGAATRVNANLSQFGVSEGRPTGIAQLGDNLYMLGWDTDMLYQINPTTSAATAIGSISEGRPMGMTEHRRILYFTGFNTDATNIFTDNAPTVTIDFPPTTGQIADLIIDWNTPVTGFTQADITLTGATYPVGASLDPVGHAVGSYSIEITTPDSSEDIDVTVTIAEDAVTEGNAETTQTGTLAANLLSPMNVTPTPDPIVAGSAVAITINWGQAVTGFEQSDITLTGATIASFTNVANLNTVFIVSALIPDSTTDVPITLTIARNAITERNSELTYDFTATANILGATPTITFPSNFNAGTVSTLTITWDMDVTGFEATDITVTGAARSNVLTAVSATQYTIPITVPPSLTDIVVTATIAEDAVNENNAETSNMATAMSNLVPANATITFPTPFNAGTTSNVNIGWDQIVSGFDDADITVTGATAGSLVGMGSTYVLPITVMDSLTDIVVTVAIAEDAVTLTNDAVSEMATASANLMPAVPTFTFPTPFNAGATSNVTITWDQSVTGFADDDITVTGGTAGSLTGSGTTYTLPVTIANSLTDIPVAITIRANAVDQTNAVAVGNGTAVSNLVPAVPTISFPSDFMAGQENTITITWDRVVTGFTNSDLAVTGGTITDPLDGSGTTYTVGITVPSSLTDVTVNVAIPLNAVPETNAAIDVDGTAVADLLPAVPTITFPTPFNAGATSNISITWDRSVTGFDNTDITVTGATEGTLTGSGTSYTLPVTVATSLTNIDVTVAIAENAVTETNASRSAMGTAQADQAQPTGTITFPTPFNTGGDRDITITWNRAVTGFDNTDITVTGATEGTLTGSGTTYTLPITLDNSFDPIDVIISVIQDAVTETNAAFSGSARASANRTPAIPTITFQDPIMAGATATISITWDQNVTFTQGDVTVTGAPITSFSGSGMMYTIVLTIPSSIVDIPLNVTIAENAVPERNPATTASATATADVTPAVPTVTFPDPFVAGADYNVPILWDESVTGFEQDDLTITNATINSFSGSGTDYVVNITIPDSDIPLNVDLTIRADAVDQRNVATNVSASATNNLDPRTRIREVIIERIIDAITELEFPTETSRKAIQVCDVRERLTVPKANQEHKMPIVSFGYGNSNGLNQTLLNEETDSFQVLVYTTFRENIDIDGNIIREVDDNGKPIPEDQRPPAIPIMKVAAKMQTAMTQVAATLEGFHINADDGQVERVGVRRAQSLSGKSTKYEFIAFTFQFRVNYKPHDFE